MISVGSSDGRKGLSLGFGVGRNMEETELEEGEACFYLNDEDPTLDPDVALSYLDEKLEHVLGHFQKDFEGGVSAENLGSKFGGYGSFLPTYQRSPAWSHPRTPPKVQNHNASRSPNNLHLEGDRCNSVSSSASVTGRLGPTVVSMGSSAQRASSMDDCGKREATMSSTPAENKSDIQSDQKTLKVRIKMGSDNLPTRKNAEIYSGLGLDVSPTSSIEDSPTNSELSRERQGSPDESPISILEIMTSFPVHGGLLLSPLHDDLVFLTEKEKLLKQNRSVPIVHQGSQEGSLIAVNGSDSARVDRKVLGEKRPKTCEKKSFALELKNENVKNVKNGVDILLKKETDLDTSACDELVSNALRLPLLSNSYGSVVDSAKDAISRVSNKGGMKEESSSDPGKDKPLEQVPGKESGLVGKPNGKTGSARKVWEFERANSDDDESGYPVKGGNLKGEKADLSFKVNSNVSKGRKGFNTELMDPAKHKVTQKAIFYDEDDTKVSSGKENSSSGSKRKSKGSLSHGAEAITEVTKDNIKADIVSAPKSRKGTQFDSRVSSSEVEDSKKDIGKAKDRYRDFFGELELEEGLNEIAEDMPSANRQNYSLMAEKSSSEFINAPKERSNGKKIDQPSTSDAYARLPSSVAPPTGNRPVSDVTAPVAPLVKEDWVCCDKCQKWRLLPNGTNPESLPKIWLCSMLNWLDGMNRCSISEEETTRAVLSLHQTFAPGSVPVPAHCPAPGPAPEGRSSQSKYAGGMLTGFPVDAVHVDQCHQDMGGKKKHGSRDANPTNQNGSSPYINSKKKNPQASAKSRNLNGENQSPSLNEVDVQHSGQSSGFVGEKHRHKKKEKNKQLENYPSEGDAKSLKIQNKREADQDFSKASKKLKINGVHHIDEDWKSDNGGAALKVGRSSSSGLSVKETGKSRDKYNDHPKHSKRDSKVSPEDQPQFTSDAGYKDRDAKKRKVNEYQDAQLNTSSFANGGHRLEDRRDLMEETSESNHRKEKKSRVSRSGGKENSISKGSGGTDKKGRSVKDEQLEADLGNNLSQQSLDAIEFVKRDMGSVQPSVAATSSSSKVSGSHKNKASLQEVKGSPVESVSSSPLRVFNPDKFTSNKRNLGGKGDSRDSPRKCSDGEDVGVNDRSGMIPKDVALTAINRGSLESSVLDFQERDSDQLSRRKEDPVPYLDYTTHHVTDTLQGDQYYRKPQNSDQPDNDESANRNQCHTNGSRRKSGKGSSSRSKDKSRGSRSESDKGSLSDKGNLKASDLNEQLEHSPYDENSKARSQSEEKFALFAEKVEKNIFPKKDSVANLFSESGKREGQSNVGSYDGSDIRQTVIPSHESKQNLPLDCNGERSSKKFPSDKTDRMDVSGKGKSHSLPPSGRGQSDTTRWPQPISGSHKENGISTTSVDGIEGDDALKPSKQIKKAENQNGNPPSRHPINSHKRDIDAPSPVRRDSSSLAATNAVKEAKDLKHLADRLKNSGSNLESTGLYFQAALKFLHGASLLESCNSENSKHGEMIQSMQMYSSTAKLCEFCAHEYEKAKDMASAALAYKCVEVAYLRVINSSHTSASKDRHELQTALQIVPLGESPSSSASDIDNLNNPVAVDKVALNKGVSSPQVVGNHVIAARNRSNFVRLLNFAQDVNFAMEASRKSRIAFAAAANSRLEEAKFREGMPSVKKALDFNFQDVEGLLRLVRLAMEAISR